MRYSLFSDPLYNSDRVVEFEPLDVVTVQHKQIPLAMRGKHWVTHIVLKNGQEYSLEGLVGDEIETARRRARAALANG